MASTVVAELNALIEDSLQTLTYKFVSKRFNISYDVSKQILYEYKANNGQRVLVTYLLSGYDTDDRHVVKVVEESKLEEEKGKMNKIESLHVYSVQPKGVRCTENIHEVDLGQNREALGSNVGAQYAGLGRIERQQMPERKALDAGPIRASLASKPVAKISNIELHTEAKQNTKVTKAKRSFMIDSDDDENEGKGPGSVPDKKFKTYINDNGEEVTEMEAPQEKKPDVKKELPKNKNGSNAPKKATKQTGIASFFSKKSTS